MSSCKKNCFRPGLEQLEQRDVPSATLGAIPGLAVDDTTPTSSKPNWDVKSGGANMSNPFPFATELFSDSEPSLQFVKVGRIEFKT